METKTRIKTGLSALLNETPELHSHKTSSTPISNYSTINEDQDGELIRLTPRISKFMREYD